MKTNLDNWVFTYCSHTNKWLAATRDNYFQLFNGNKGDVLTSSSHDTLVELIERTSGDKDKINDLLRQWENLHNYKNSN